MGFIVRPITRPIVELGLGKLEHLGKLHTV